MARTEGTVTASVALSQQASVERIVLQTASGKVSPLLARGVEKLLREATFDSGCGGKTITLTFEFKNGEASSEPSAQSVVFVSPNTFWIVSERVRVPTKTAARQEIAPKLPDPVNVRLGQTPGSSKDAPLYVANVPNDGTWWTADHVLALMSAFIALMALGWSIRSIRNQHHRFEYETFISLLNYITESDRKFRDKYYAPMATTQVKADAVDEEGRILFNALEVLSLLVNNGTLKYGPIVSKLKGVVKYFDLYFTGDCAALSANKDSYKEFRKLVQD
jgi:hypothetical protein